jgi:hypothetical protein
MMHSLVRSRTQVARRVCRGLSTETITQRAAVATKTRAELHAEAMKINAKHHVKMELKFRTEPDIAMTSIPRDIKFHFRDSAEEREWKRRQQHYYYLEETYGYIEDALAREGLASQVDIDAKREFIKKRIASRHMLLDEVRTPKVKLADLKEVEETYNVPQELRIAEGDSPAEKKRKVRGQVEHFVKTSREELAKRPSTHKEVKALLKQAEDNYRLEEDVDMFFLENEEKLKEDFVWDEAKIVEFSREVRTLAVEAFGDVEVDSFTKSSALTRLGLIPRGTLDTIEAELRSAKYVAIKRSAEFELRFGSLPDMAKDPYMLEFKDQFEFLKAKEIEAFNAKQLAATQAEQDNADSPAAPAEEVDEDKETLWDPDQEGLLEVLPPNWKADYDVQRTPRTFLSSEAEDGTAWPKIVDGLTLSEYDHLRDVNYEDFEDPPDEMETRVLDAFAMQRQMRNAKEKNITLVPRVHIPSSPHDGSLIAKTLLLYRMQAIRRHIFMLEVKRKKEYDVAYRDLNWLNLSVPYDPDQPWKQDTFEEARLVLMNQVMRANNYYNPYTPKMVDRYDSIKFLAA